MSNKTEKIEFLPVADLRPYDRNSRTHSPEQVEQLVASIREFGFTDPVLIDESNMILAGHGRCMAANKLELATVPCRRITGLSDAQKRAYVIADNKLALNAGWDDDILKAELADLHDLQFDLTLTGFDTRELDAMLTEQTRSMTASQLQQAETETDKAPISETAFQAEMQRKDTKGQAPIVPMYAEHHEAFIIVCDNTIDEAWLRNKLRLEQPMQSYKDVKTQRANVITVSQLREALK